jgi:hypothetical protein
VLLMVYCCKVPNYVYIYRSHCYFLCYVYVSVYLPCSYIFLSHIRLFSVYVASIL